MSYGVVCVLVYELFRTTERKIRCVYYLQFLSKVLYLIFAILFDCCWLAASIFMTTQTYISMGAGVQLLNSFFMIWRILFICAYIYSMILACRSKALYRRIQRDFKERADDVIEINGGENPASSKESMVECMLKVEQRTGTSL
jgi:uncharacterized BrkB/YihY/UPF0761 family membrane protein